MPLEWAPRARKDLRRIHPEEARRVTEAVNRYFDTALGDVRYLKGSEQLFRLRVGDYRVIFHEKRDYVRVSRVLHRKDAY